MSRLFIALPVATAVVVALFWVMSEVVLMGRPRVDYTVIIDDGPRKIFICRGYCGGEGDPPPSPVRPDGRDAQSHRDLPPPPRVEPDTGEPQTIPREPLRSPQPERPDSGLWPVDRCAVTNLDGGNRVPPHLWQVVRHGDYVVIEFMLGADGVPRDVEVVDSSNPKIDEHAVRVVRRWRYKPDCVDGELVDKERETKRVRIEFDLSEMKDADRQ